MFGKTDTRFMFDVKLNWLADKTGILYSKEANGMIHVATPPQFGGEGRFWSPEHLFLGSVSSCFMTTYLSFAGKLNFDISGLDCDSIGQVEIVEGKFKFTRIDVYPRIGIADENLRAKATTALEKTHKYCLIANSVNATIFYHSEIVVNQIVATEPGGKNNSLEMRSQKINSSL